MKCWNFLMTQCKYILSRVFQTPRNTKLRYSLSLSYPLSNLPSLYLSICLSMFFKHSISLSLSLLLSLSLNVFNSVNLALFTPKLKQTNKAFHELSKCLHLQLFGWAMKPLCDYNWPPFCWAYTHMLFNAYSYRGDIFGPLLKTLQAVVQLTTTGPHSK